MLSLPDLASGVQCIRARLTPKCNRSTFPVSCYTDLPYWRLAIKHTTQRISFSHSQLIQLGYCNFDFPIPRLHTRGYCLGFNLISWPRAFARISFPWRVSCFPSPFPLCRAFLGKMPYALALITLGCDLRPNAKRRFEYMPCYLLPLEFWTRVETRTSWVGNFRRFYFWIVGRVLPSYIDCAFNNFHTPF